MDFIREINAFESWTRTNYLPATSQLLWYKVFMLCNRAGWPEWVTVDNLSLMALVQIKHANTFTECRRKLIEAGLLEFKQGGKGRPSKYKLVSITEHSAKIAPQTAPKAESNSEWGAKIAPHSAPLYKLKQNENKNKDKDVSSELPANAGTPSPKCSVETKPEQGIPRSGLTKLADGVATTLNLNGDSEQQQSASAVAISLPLSGGGEQEITWVSVREWSALYPAVDVLQELRKMRGWAGANPTKRKTKRGIFRHIVNWLAKEQDKGGAKDAADRNTRAGNNGKSQKQTEGDRLQRLAEQLEPIGDTECDF